MLSRDRTDSELQSTFDGSVSAEQTDRPEPLERLAFLIVSLLPISAVLAD